MVEVRRFASPEGRHKTKASFCESQREKAPGHRARRQPKSPRERQQRTRHMANCYSQSWPEAKAFGGMGHSVCVNWGESSCLSVPGQCGLRGQGVWCLCVCARACTCVCVCVYVCVCVGVGLWRQPVWRVMCSWLSVAKLGVWYLHMSDCVAYYGKGWDRRLCSTCGIRMPLGLSVGCVRRDARGAQAWAAERSPVVHRPGSDLCHSVTILSPLPRPLRPPLLPLPHRCGPGPWKRHQTQSCPQCPRPAGVSASGRRFPPRSPWPAC